MRIPRIYHPATLHCGEQYCLDESASKHLLRVLRLRPGAPLILFNGEGGEFQGTLIESERHTATVLVETPRATETESPLDITLAQGISRGERMDYTLQKAVELGVNHIVPLVTEYCGVKLSGQRLEKRLQHWRGIITHACEQSGRTCIPDISTVLSLSDWIGHCQEEQATRLMLDPQATDALADLPPPNGPIILAIGPEGGLSTPENRQLEKHGFLSVRLGPRILRTETAGMAALAALQTLWGDFRSIS